MTYAQLRFFSQEGKLDAEARQVIDHLLAKNSDHEGAIMLMGMATFTHNGVTALLVYLALYVAMSAAAFGCVLISGRERIADYAGLGKTRPLLAASIAALMFSMAGIPPLAGFFGKMWVIVAAIDAGMLWLAASALIASVVSCYYYIKVVKVMYFDEPAAFAPTSAQSALVVVATGLALAVTLFFFLLPSPLMDAAKTAASALVK